MIKKKIRRIKNIRFSKINPIRYELFVLVGFIIVVAAFIKLLGIYDFSSDWFWFFVGIGLVVEGTIALVKQKAFDKKYKIIEKSN